MNPCSCSAFDQLIDEQLALGGFGQPIEETELFSRGLELPDGFVLGQELLPQDLLGAVGPLQAHVLELG
jgi:hypothetical protein